MATMSKPGEPGLAQGGTGTNEIAQKAKETASEVAGLAKEKLSADADRRRERAASSIGSVAEALRKTGDEIGEEGMVSDYLGKAAEGVERIGEYFRSKDLGEVVEDVERFARKEPALFLGAAFTAGLLGARFLKSSSRRRTGPQRSYDTGARGYGDRYEPPRAAPRPEPITPYAAAPTGTTGGGIGAAGVTSGAKESRPSAPGLGTTGGGTGGRP